MKKRDFPPIHPGEILVEEFLEPLGISQYRLAKDIGVTPRRINEIVHGRRAIAGDTALRLARFFGVEAQFWLNQIVSAFLVPKHRDGVFASANPPERGSERI